jgi:hypothetical protein
MQSIGEPGLPRIYVNRHGAISIMNTAAIGARPAAPVASPAPKPEPPQTESVITAASSLSDLTVWRNLQSKKSAKS